MKKEYRYDIALLRILCIAVVVFFHAYGMTYANHLDPTVAEIYKEKYEIITAGGLINVAMPMFVFISGFLFGGQLMRPQPVTFAKMVNSKFMRLMLPFFVFTVIFMATTNSLSLKPFYQWTFWHLWFLPMLFWCFIVTYFLRPLIMNRNPWIAAVTLIALFALSLAGKIIPPILGLHGVSHWLCWFALGAWFFKHENIFSRRETKIWVAIAGSAAYILLSVVFPPNYGENTVLSEFTSLCGMAAIWCAVGLVSYKNDRFTSLIVGLSGASFGIYIFHNWIEMYMVSTTARRLFPIDSFAMENTILFPLLFSLIAFAISYFLSYRLLKTRIGRQLIG